MDAGDTRLGPIRSQLVALGVVETLEPNFGIMLSKKWDVRPFLQGRFWLITSGLSSVNIAVMKRAKRGIVYKFHRILFSEPIDFTCNIAERFFDRLVSALLKWNGPLWWSSPSHSNRATTMYGVEDIAIEIECACEAKGDGFLGYCFKPATPYYAEADETGLTYFCEAHRPGADTDTAPSYPTN